MPSRVSPLPPLTALLLTAAPMLAQEVDEAAMEVQRCVWRCLAEHGVDSPDYPACVGQFCSDGLASGEETAGAGELSPLPPAPDQSPLPPGPGVLAGQWVWADHPVLGPSAHIDTAAGTVGFGCVGEGPNIGLRLSNSLVQSGAVTLMTEPFNWGQTLDLRQGDWSGSDDDVCWLPVLEFATAQRAYLIPARITGGEGQGEALVTSLSDGSRSVEVRNGPEAFAHWGGYVLPMTGAHHAISVLLAHCPAAEQQLVWGCGD